MSYSILVWAHLDQAARDLIQAELKNDRVQICDPHTPEATDQAALAQAEIVFGNLPAKWLSNCPRLRWMQLESIGFEYYQHLAGGLNGLKVSNLNGMFDRPASETALAGMLALGRRLDRLLPAQKAAIWMPLSVRPDTRLLHGSHVVLLGLGSIGRRLQVILEAFDCKITTFARSNGGANLTTVAQLEQVFPSADYVVCSLPKTPQTIGLVNRRLIECLPPHAVFVNIGRGAVVEEDALIERLQAGRLGGAVIDVTVTEPLPPDHPWWRCPNTILTQHTGGGYDDELLDKARFFLKNLERFRRGEAVLNLIDIKRGY